MYPVVAGFGKRRQPKAGTREAEQTFVMNRRRNAFKFTFLTAAVALIALCLTALACTPSAPSRQASEPAELVALPVATATAEVTTNTPATEPTATATAAPKPAASSKLEPMLNALAAQSQSAGAQGATGQTTRMVGVVIDPAGDTQSVFLANSEAIDRVVTDNGGLFSEVETWTHTIPVALLPHLSAHSAVDQITAAKPKDFPYPNMNRTLNNAVAAWQAGATPQQAVAYSALKYDDKILTFIDMGNEAAFERVEAFFVKNKVYVYPDRREADLATLSMMVLVPVSLLASLSQVSGVTEIEDSGLVVVSGESPSLEAQEFYNLYLYGALPPDLRSRLSPLPTEVWELEGITPTPTPTPTLAPAPSSGRVVTPRLP